MKKGALTMEKIAMLLIALAILILAIMFIIQLKTGGLNLSDKIKELF